MEEVPFQLLNMSRDPSLAGACMHMSASASSVLHAYTDVHVSVETSRLVEETLQVAYALSLQFRLS